MLTQQQEKGYGIYRTPRFHDSHSDLLCGNRLSVGQIPHAMAGC